MTRVHFEDSNDSLGFTSKVLKGTTRVGMIRSSRRIDPETEGYTYEGLDEGRVWHPNLTGLKRKLRHSL